MSKSSGQIAYEGYFKHSGGKSLVSGAPMPTWEGQAKAIQEAWQAAASAVLDDHTAMRIQSRTGTGLGDAGDPAP